VTNATLLALLLATGIAVGLVALAMLVEVK
jgi:hypothetical protein